MKTLAELLVITGDHSEPLPSGAIVVFHRGKPAPYYALAD